MKQYLNWSEVQKELDAESRRKALAVCRPLFLLQVCCVCFVVGGFFGATLVLLAEVMR